MVRSIILVVAAIAVLAYGGAAALLFTLQRGIVFVPDTTPPSAAQVGLASLQAVELPTPGGLRLLAWWLPPPPGRPVLAYFHGNGGNLGDRRDRLRGFAAAGFGVLMPEYPGYGGNPGSPSETGFDETATAALSFLDQQGVERRRVVVYGESIGTGVATWLASGRDVGALVLESPFTSLRPIARRQFPWLPVRLLLRDPFDQLSRIGAVRCPILILQGSRDVVVPPELGRRLFAAAPEPKTLWVAPDGGHTDLFAFGAADVVTRFIDRTIVQAAPPPGQSR